MQGRLVESVTGALDCPPGPRWREDLARAGNLGLQHLELVAEKVPDPVNPIWTKEGRRQLNDAAQEAGIVLSSLCINELLVTTLEEISADLGSRLEPVLAELPVQVVVLPLLERSDLGVDRDRTARAVAALALSLSGHGIRLVLEVGLGAENALEFLDEVGSPHVGLCFDTGNCAAFGLDAPTELIRLGAAVWHVHAKDKDAQGNNVRFGTGLVDFDGVFTELVAQGFNGMVTMEATRGEDPQVTAAEHRDFLLAAAEKSQLARDSA